MSDTENDQLLENEGLDGDCGIDVYNGEWRRC